MYFLLSRRLFCRPLVKVSSSPKIRSGRVPKRLNTRNGDHIAGAHVPPKADRQMGPGLSPSSRCGFSPCRALGLVSFAIVGESAQSAGPHNLGPSPRSRAAAVPVASAALLDVILTTLGSRGRCCCLRCWCPLRCRRRAAAAAAAAVAGCVPGGCSSLSPPPAEYACCTLIPARFRCWTRLYFQAFLLDFLSDTAGGRVWG